MLLLAFGAALFGVMALHKLRERRISNLLLKDKDRELFSLHLLLQRERDHNNEMKRKFERMKEKMYAFRTQNMELASTVLEMQSTVRSLKDEMRAMESALQEKDNELKMLRGKNTEASRKDAEEVSLREILKLKEAQIEDLKQHLEKQVNIGSASSNDPSSLPRNSSTQGGEVQKDETSNAGVEEKGELARKSIRTPLIERKNEVLDGEVASRSDPGSEDKLGSADKKEVRELEELQGKGGSSDEHQEQRQVFSEGNGTEDRRVNLDGLQDQRKSDIGDGTNTPIETSTSNDADEVSRNRNENGNAETVNVKESLEESGAGKGGMKLKTSENSHSYESDPVVVGKQGNPNASKKRGKKWRMLARNRRLENMGNKKGRHIGHAKETELLESAERNQQIGTRLRRDESEQRGEQERKAGRDQVGIKSAPADSSEERVTRGEKSDESQENLDKFSNFLDTKSIESEISENKGDVGDTAMNGGKKGHVKNEREETKSGNLSTNGKVPTNSTSRGEANNITNEDGEEEADVEIRRQEDQGDNAVLKITQVETGGAVIAVDKERVPDRIEEPRYSDYEDSKESEAGGDRRDFSQKTDNKDDYKAETDDSGF
ncbi:uncharacterized protein J3R85_003150 [Psidium guajava]|nr:uncharacterized protein J3R85_003150 [Psidium guajava]